jgi:hypothetical protein
VVCEVEGAILWSRLARRDPETGTARRERSDTGEH